MIQTEEKPAQKERKPFSIEELRGGIANAQEEWRKSEFPIAKNSDRIKDIIRKHDSIILEAETGSGKSTVAPPLFLDALLEDDPDAKVMVTQPRRLATESVAKFVGKQIGQEFVDYRYKGHHFTKPNARLHYTVEQSLLNELIDNPLLEEYSAVVVDEVQSSIHLLLPLLKQAQRLRKERGKKSLKVILTSGTLDAELLSGFFPGAHFEHVEGRAFPVDPHFADKDYTLSEMPKAAAQKAAELFADPTTEGDGLIFMPGKTEITETKKEIEMLLTDPRIEIVTLMGGDQDGDPYEKINNNPGNKRRIYIATDVAETSLTIPNITMVIDSGLQRKMVYDPQTHVTTLETLPHAFSNWLQRIGRAGRTQAGRAYALFTKESLEKREQNQKAEILYTDLTPLILKMKAIGVPDVYSFEYLQPPPKETIDRAVVTLQQLGALDATGAITTIGQEMAKSEEDPHFVRMLIEAKKRQCLDAVTVLIGMMKTRTSVFALRRGETFEKKFAQYIDPDSDYITALNAWNDYVENPTTLQHGVQIQALEQSFREKTELQRDTFFQDAVVNKKAIKIDLTPEQQEAINLSIAAGCMDRVLVKEGYSTYRFKTGATAGIKLDDRSVFAKTRPEILLLGHIYSSKKTEKDTVALMNLSYNEEKFYEAFPYLKELVIGEGIGRLADSSIDKTAESIAQKQQELLAHYTEEKGEEQAQEGEIKHKARSPMEKVGEAIRNAFEKVKATLKKVGNTIRERLKL